MQVQLAEAVASLLRDRFPGMPVDRMWKPLPSIEAWKDVGMDAGPRVLVIPAALMGADAIDDRDGVRRGEMGVNVALVAKVRDFENATLDPLADLVDALREALFFAALPALPGVYWTGNRPQVQVEPKMLATGVFVSVFAAMYAASLVPVGEGAR